MPDQWINIPLEITPGVVRILQDRGFVPSSGEITVHTVAAGIVGALAQAIKDPNFRARPDEPASPVEAPPPPPAAVAPAPAPPPSAATTEPKPPIADFGKPPARHKRPTAAPKSTADPPAPKPPAAAAPASPEEARQKWAAKMAVVNHWDGVVDA